MPTIYQATATASALLLLTDAKTCIPLPVLLAYFHPFGPTLQIYIVPDTKFWYRVLNSPSPTLLRLHLVGKSAGIYLIKCPMHCMQLCICRGCILQTGLILTGSGDAWPDVDGSRRTRHSRIYFVAFDILSNRKLE